jgi:hypothetical protein
MGWFPGYAIDVETGERLNVIFGEDSWLSQENGRDMIWNPTSTLIDQTSGDWISGGKHYLYILRSLEYKATSNVPRDFIFLLMMPVLLCMRPLIGRILLLVR